MGVRDRPEPCDLHNLQSPGPENRREIPSRIEIGVSFYPIDSESLHFSGRVVVFIVSVRPGPGRERRFEYIRTRGDWTRECVHQTLRSKDTRSTIRTLGCPVNSGRRYNGTPWFHDSPLPQDRGPIGEGETVDLRSCQPCSPQTLPPPSRRQCRVVRLRPHPSTPPSSSGPTRLRTRVGGEPGKKCVVPVYKLSKRRGKICPFDSGTLSSTRCRGGPASRSTLPARVPPIRSRERHSVSIGSVGVGCGVSEGREGPVKTGVGPRGVLPESHPRRGRLTGWDLHDGQTRVTFRSKLAVETVNIRHTSTRLLKTETRPKAPIFYLWNFFFRNCFPVRVYTILHHSELL